LRDEILRTGGEQVPEPKRFRRLAVKAYLAERISRARLAELLDINIAEVEDEVRRFGGEDASRGVKVSLPR